MSLIWVTTVLKGTLSSENQQQHVPWGNHRPSHILLACVDTVQAPSAVACGFCGMKGDGGLLKQSDMLGPFVQKRKEVYAHHQCLIWAPGVAESMDKVLMGVNQAVAASLTRNCT